MRPILIGLLAAMVAASLPAAALAATAAPKGPEITSDQKAQGMKAAPKLIEAAGLSCDLAAARFIGESTNPKTKADEKYYEVACKNAIGYLIVDKGPKETPVWEDCAEASRTDPATGKANLAACYLPQNMDDVAVIKPYVAASGTPCDVTKARGIGHSDKSAYFEVACADGKGYIVMTGSPPKADSSVKLATCLGFDPKQSAVACTLTNYDSQLAQADQYAANSGKPCAVTNRRYVGADTRNNDLFFEVACQGGKGYILDVTTAGKVTPYDCAIADGVVSGGCTLTNGRAAQTEEAALYSKLAKGAGFNCDVAKYAPFTVSPPGDEAVELSCSNRTDGAVGIFPVSSHDTAVIYDCAHAVLEGYRCGFSDSAASASALTADLNKLGKMSCTVSGQRYVGSSDDTKTGYIEVACADGNPGYIIEYAVSPLVAKQAIPCVAAQGLGGGCTLPTNSKKG